MGSGRRYRPGYRFSFVLISVLFDVWYAHGHFDRGTDCVMSLLHLLSVGFTEYHSRQGLEHVETIVELSFFLVTKSHSIPWIDTCFGSTLRYHHLFGTNNETRAHCPLLFLVQCPPRVRLLFCFLCCWRMNMQGTPQGCSEAFARPHMLKSRLIVHCNVCLRVGLKSLH